MSHSLASKIKDFRNHLGRSVNQVSLRDISGIANHGNLFLFGLNAMIKSSKAIDHLARIRVIRTVLAESKRRDIETIEFDRCFTCR